MERSAIPQEDLRVALPRSAPSSRRARAYGGRAPEVPPGRRAQIPHELSSVHALSLLACVPVSRLRPTAFQSHDGELRRTRAFAILWPAAREPSGVHWCEPAGIL